MPRVLGCLVLAILLAGPGLHAFSQGAGDGKKEESQKLQAGDVELMADAFNLAETAQKLKIPEAYVAAGRLMLRLEHLTKGKIGKIEADFRAEDENGKPVKAAKVEAGAPTGFAKLAEGYFADASLLAVEQKNIDAVRSLIKAVKDDPGGVSERGAIGGPKMIARVIGPKQMHTWTFAFDTHSVGAIGFQAGAPLHCKMVNQDGRGHFDQTLAVGRYTWQPKGMAGYRAFVVTIRNPSTIAIPYKLFTN